MTIFKLLWLLMEVNCLSIASGGLIAPTAFESVSNRIVSCHSDDWTEYFNADDALGEGDFESLYVLRRTFPEKICSKPTAADGRVRGTLVHYSLSGQTVTVDKIGLVCKNENQVCVDYEVRFCCPKIPECVHGEWTSFFNVDDPSQGCDCEFLSTLELKYGEKVCEKSTAIDARTSSDKIHWPYTRFKDQITVDNEIGFRCDNTISEQCDDFEVRFCCSTVAKHQCDLADWTVWFNHDTPSGKGDIETIAVIDQAFPEAVCSHPSALEVRSETSGNLINLGSAAWNINASPTYGFSCLHKPGLQCDDYSVRFCCPKENRIPECKNGKWSEYFDIDDPSEYGDFETVWLLKQKLSDFLCNNWDAVDARLVGTDIHHPIRGQKARLTIEDGFSCKNAENPSGCEDYEIRFCCLPSPEICEDDQWTDFFDTDNPDGSGDFEDILTHFNIYPGKLCPNPTAIDVRTESGSHYSVLNQNVHISLKDGFRCYNDQPQGQRCCDYKVRYCCPEQPDCNDECSLQQGTWTDFYDLDDPLTSSMDTCDCELLSDIRAKYPSVCEDPVAIDAKLLNGDYYTVANQVVELSPTEGLKCLNEEQTSDENCRDYKVRFCCLQIGCEAPPSVDEATVAHNILPLNVGQTANYTCADGFRLEGTATVVCQSDGTYAPDPPECTRMCPPVDQGTPGTISVILSDPSLDVDEPVQIGTIAEYTCRPSLVQLLPDETQSTCTDFTNGPSWVPAMAPGCIPGCRIPEDFANSGGTLEPPYPSDIYPPSIQLLVICPSGDTDPRGITTVTCDGDFGPLETVVCAPVVECGEPDTFPGASGITGPTGADTSPYLDGETQTYNCDHPLQSPDPSVSTCTDEDWSITLADPPTCSQTRCSPPVGVDNANVRFSNGDEAEDDAYEVNDLLTYFCDEGFFTTVPEDDRITECENNGGFAFSLDNTIEGDFICQQGCSPPAEFDDLFLAFPNGDEATDPGYAENVALTYQCEAGFVPTSSEADRTITCGKLAGNFMFSAIGFDPTSECQPVCETDPDSPTNGDFAGAPGPPYDVGYTVVYECFGDLVTIPTNGDGKAAHFTNECIGSNTWQLSSGDDDFPMCVCIALPDVANQDPAQMVGIGTEVGTSELYLCETGFTLIEPGTENECTGDPTYGWSLTDAGANLPSCLEACSAPIGIAHGQVGENEPLPWECCPPTTETYFLEGSKLTYFCDDGYGSALPYTDRVTECVSDGAGGLIWTLDSTITQPSPTGIGCRKSGAGALNVEWPWMAYVYELDSSEAISRERSCAGSLVHDKWVVSAAHCFATPLASLYGVTLGIHTIYGRVPSEQIRTVSRIIVHPQFDSTTYDFDIALLELAEPVQWNDFMRPIFPDGNLDVLENEEPITSDENCTLIFWNHLLLSQSQDVATAALQKLDKKIGSELFCIAESHLNKDNYNNRVVVEGDPQLCAYSDGVENSCDGDNGGQLVCKKEDGRYFLYGILSYGGNDCEEIESGVFTSVPDPRIWAFIILNAF